MNWMEANVMSLAGKLGTNRYLKAISSGFIAILAATIVGSIFTLIGNLPFTEWTAWLASTGSTRFWHCLVSAKRI